MNWKESVKQDVKRAKAASFSFSQLTRDQKDQFLQRLAVDLEKNTGIIVKENGKDVAKAKASGLSSALIDRLMLTDERIQKMAESLRNISLLADPVGEVIWEKTRPNGLVIQKVRVPIGVISIIYEARPDVTVEAACLCIKSGNCVILRGGKEARRSNLVLVSIMKESLAHSGMSPDGVAFIASGGRQAVKYLLKLRDDIDLVIPRGGYSLIDTVVKTSEIPVIKHYKGVCHTFVDRDADDEMALKVCLNAKVQRPATCNAMETLLVHAQIASSFLPKMAELFAKHNVEMRGCPRARTIVPDMKEAAEHDWGYEYLDLIIAIRVVDSVDDAIAHINQYGTKHSDAIITENRATAERFLRYVDSACVYHNTSTRFTDGGQFGFGAEIGISTDKIHARGPMALEELTSYKYIIHGNGQLRQ